MKPPTPPLLKNPAWYIYIHIYIYKMARNMGHLMLIELVTQWKTGIQSLNWMKHEYTTDTRRLSKEELTDTSSERTPDMTGFRMRTIYIRGSNKSFRLTSQKVINATDTWGRTGGSDWSIVIKKKVKIRKVLPTKLGSNFSCPNTW